MQREPWVSFPAILGEYLRPLSIAVSEARPILLEKSVVRARQET